MNSSLILGFLRRVMANNNRQWFQEHKNYTGTVMDHCRAAVAACGLEGKVKDFTVYDIYKRKRHVNISCNYDF